MFLAREAAQAADSLTGPEILRADCASAQLDQEVDDAVDVEKTF